MIQSLINRFGGSPIYPAWLIAIPPIVFPQFGHLLVVTAVHQFAIKYFIPYLQTYLVTPSAAVEIHVKINKF